MNRRNCWLVAVSLLVIGGVTWGVNEKYRFIPKRWGVVEPQAIYRSGQLSKWVVEKTLTKHSIQVIVNLQGFATDDEHHQAEVETSKKHGIDIVWLPLQGDGTGDIRHYATAIKMLVDCQKQQRPVLVHCAAGAYRTGGVVAAYRLLVQRRSPEFACEELEKYGWTRSSGQILIDYLNNHMKELSELLVANGVLDQVPQPLPALTP